MKAAQSMTLLSLKTVTHIHILCNTSFLKNKQRTETKQKICHTIIILMLMQWNTILLSYTNAVSVHGFHLLSVTK